MQELLENLRAIMGLYDALCRQVCARHEITRTELDVLAFLSNHPGQNTASDIVEIRMLPKANVSQAVEALIKKGYLLRLADRQDRRKIRLSLTPQAAGTVKDIGVMQRQHRQIHFGGFSEEEKQQYKSMVARMSRNARNELERMKETHGAKE